MDKDKNKTPPTVAQSDAAVGSGVNAPKLNEDTLKPEVRSILDAAQAYSIAKALEQANETRNKKNAVIWRKYNGDPPYNQKDLIDANENWRSNASFGFLSGIVSRVVPAPVQIIDGARYLTSATLKAKTEEAANKSENFRRIVTKAIRQWDGWKSFNYALSQEDVLMGGALVAWLDEDDPFPRFFRQDEAFVPDGTLQQSKTAQLFVAKQSWLIHEAVEFIKEGKEVAEAAKWDVDAMVETINAAMPKNPTSDGTGGQARSYEDTVREGNIGQSYTTGAKVIEVYQILAVEADGKVTHFIVDRRNNHKALYQKDDRYEKMSDQLVLFTLEPGNGKFYSSKGLGRMLINQHISLERMRNVTIDNVYLSGLMILQADPNKAPQIQTKLTHPFILTTTDATFVEQQIQSNVDEFLSLDNKITQLAEIAAGAYIPDKINAQGGGDKTATEASIDANREAQAKIAFLSRFWGQFADMVSNIQKKLCKKGSSNEIVKQVLKELEEEGLTKEEIEELANAPAAEVVQDMTQTQNSQKVAVFEAGKGDPNFDQPALYQMGVTAMSTPEVADSVLIPKEFDQVVEAEAMQKQILESSAMENGNPVPVSPRDNHAVHLNVIAGQLKEAWAGVEKNAAIAPELLDHVNLAMVHAKAHIDVWKQLGAKPEEVKPFEDALAMAEKGIIELAQGIQEQKMQGQMMGGEEQMPPQDSNVPPQGPMPAEPPPPETQPVMTGAPMTEKVLTSWIGQYDKLLPPERKALEVAGGLAQVEASMPPMPPDPMMEEQEQMAGQSVRSVSNMQGMANAPQPPPPAPAPEPPPVEPPMPEALPPTEAGVL